MSKNQKGEEFDVTVKLAGITLEKLMHVRNKREKETGRLAPIAKLVKEAIEEWYILEEANGKKM
jgi:hypothetical protein